MRRYGNLLGVWTLLLLFLGSPSEEGIAQEKGLRVPIDFALDGVRAGQVETMITDEGKIYLPIKELKDFLRGRVKEEVWSRISEGAMPGFVELENLAEAGLETTFDRQLLALHIRVPPALRASQDILLSGAPSISDPQTDYPAPFSGYLNVSSSVSFWYEPYAAEPVTLPLYLSASPTLNYRGWVLEAGVSAVTYPNPDITFEYERLIKDFEPYSARLTLGTSGIAVQGFQSPLILEGVSILRDPALFRKERTLSREELFLERPAIVQVYVNDQLIRTLQLDPGKHRLLNFPYVTGVNDMRLIVQEENARERVLERFVAFDGRMQPEGESSFFLGMGIPRWDPDTPTAQGSFLWGLSSWSTAGANMQGNPSRQLGGIEGLLALPVGILLSDFALGFRKYRVEDWAASLKYRISFAGRKSYPAVGVGVQYRGSRFHTPLESLQAPPPSSWELSGMISQSFPFGLSLGVSGVYQFSRMGKDRTYLSLTALQTLRKGVNLLFSVSSNRSESGVTDTRGSISITIISPEGRRTSSFTSSLSEGSGSASVQVRPEVREGTLTVDAAVEGFPVEVERPASVRFGGSYGNRFFEGSLVQNIFKGSSTYVASRLTAQARTSVAYAEGEWVISKPIYDSYTLIVPTESLQNETLWVSSTGSGDIQASRKIPGLLLLNSYEKSQLLIDAPQAPAGSEVGGNVRVLQPTYRSGTVVRAGTKPTIFIEGTLLFRGGRPVAYRAGTLTPVRPEPGSTEGEKSIPFFTDEGGVFQAYGLRAGGEYEMRISGIKTTILIRVPPEISGFVSWGTLEVSDEEK